jgi:hypothetical protein
MSAAVLLERLQGVQQSASDRWRSVCPAHESKHRTKSLSIRELDDGRVLIHCFAGCGGTDVLAAVGLEFRDLFADDHVAPNEPRHPQRQGHWHAIADALRTLHKEGFLALVAAENVANGVELSQADRDRLAVAVERLDAAVRACL